MFFLNFSDVFVVEGIGRRYAATTGSKHGDCHYRAAT